MNTNVDQDRVDDLFVQASNLPPAERAALLDSACGKDADLRLEVEKLLAAHDRSAGFLALPAAGDEVSVADSFLGQQIGPYVIKERLSYGELHLLHWPHSLRLMPPTSRVQLLPSSIL